MAMIEFHNVQKWYGDRTLYVPGHYQLVLHYMPFWCDWPVFMELLALETEKCRQLFDRCRRSPLLFGDHLRRAPPGSPLMPRAVPPGERVELSRIDEHPAAGR